MSTVRIYTSGFCPFCFAAKRLLSSLGADFEEIALDERPELRQRLSEENNGFKTVPMIFVGDEFLGGFQEVLALHSRGELVPKLGPER